MMSSARRTRHYNACFLRGLHSHILRSAASLSWQPSFSPLRHPCTVIYRCFYSQVHSVTRWVKNEQILPEKNVSASKNLPQNIAPRLHYVKVTFLPIHNLIELLVLVPIQLYFRYNVEYHLKPSTGFSLVVSSWNKVSTNRTDFRKSLMWMQKLMNKKIRAMMKFDCLSHILWRYEKYFRVGYQRTKIYQRMKVTSLWSKD